MTRGRLLLPPSVQMTEADEMVTPWKSICPDDVTDPREGFRYAWRA